MATTLNQIEFMVNVQLVSGLSYHLTGDNAQQFMVQVENATTDDTVITFWDAGASQKVRTTLNKIEKITETRSSSTYTLDEECETI